MTDNPEIYSGLARSLSDEKIPSEVARQTLASLKADRASPPLHEAVRLGRAAGLSVAEMERMSGFTRPTIYAAQKMLDEGQVPRPTNGTILARHVLVVLGSAGGWVPFGEIVGRLRLEEQIVLTALLSLQAQGMCSVDGRLVGDASTSSVTITTFGRAVLRSIFDDLFLRRPDAYSVYLQIEPRERADIERAAASVVSSHEYTVIEASVAPSKMGSRDELALIIHSPSARTAFTIAYDVWNEIRETANLPPARAWIADIIPPRPLPSGESAVLDAFCDATCEQIPEQAAEVMRERQRYSGGVDERQLAGRCVTAAARVLRQIAGSQDDLRPITDSEQAFGEYSYASALTLPPGDSPVQDATRRALDLASLYLGPYVGGGIGSFRAPGGMPNVPEEVRATAENFMEIAREAGVALGMAAHYKTVDVADQMLAVVAPR